MKYDEWEQKVPSAIKDDPLWKMTVYRHIVHCDIGWFVYASWRRIADVENRWTTFMIR